MIAYVDDILIIETELEIAKVKSQLKKIFTVSDLTICNRFLGITIIRKRDGICL